MGCLASDGHVVRVQDCGAHTGGEGFMLTDDGQLESVSDGLCISLANGDAAGGGHLVMEDCEEAAEAGDGRSNFELTSSGQVRLIYTANSCLTASQMGVRVEDCGAGDVPVKTKFYPTPVSETRFPKDLGSLLGAVTARLSSFKKLQEPNGGYSALGVDMGLINGLISESAWALDTVTAGLSSHVA